MPAMPSTAMPFALIGSLMVGGGYASGPKVTVEQTVPFGRRANLTISWDGVVDGPDHDVWVSAWSPPDFPLPFKLLPSNTSLDWLDGSGTLIFDVLNVRAPVVVRITEGNPASSGADVLAESDPVVPDDLPMQIHTSATSVS